MATLTIKDLPGNVHAILKARAQMNRRSLNSEVIVCLEQAVKSEPIDVERFLARIAERNAKLKGLYLTNEDINAAKREGRR